MSDSTTRRLLALSRVLDKAERVVDQLSQTTRRRLPAGGPKVKKPTPYEQRPADPDEVVVAEDDLPEVERRRRSV